MDFYDSNDSETVHLSKHHRPSLLTGFRILTLMITKPYDNPQYI